MKIIGIRQSYGTTNAVICEMSVEEYEIIVGHTEARFAQDHMNRESVIDIAGRFRRFRQVEDKIIEAKKVPELLKGLGEIIALSLPAIKEITEQPAE